MEQENRSFVHDTIDLDEIRSLLGDLQADLSNKSAPAEDVPVLAEIVEPEEEQTNASSEDEKKRGWHWNYTACSMIWYIFWPQSRCCLFLLSAW